MGETAAVSTAELGPRGDGLTIIVNPSAGPALAANPADLLREALPASRIVELDDPSDLPEALEKAVADGARALGVSGGDGSVNCAAEVAMDKGLPLLVVPGGTLNHLAKAIGIESVDDAIEAVRSGGRRRIDGSRIDGRLFLNTASIGGYVKLVDRRERLEGRIGKWPAFVVSLVWVLTRSKPVEVELDGLCRQVWLVFFGNCRYDPKGVTPRTRSDMADGMIDVRLLEARRSWGRLRLLRAAVTGRIPRLAAYEERLASGAKVRFPGENGRVAVDGETLDASRAFDVEKLPEALEVIVKG